MLISPQNLGLNLREVRFRIDRAAQSAGRDPAGITLIAVSKAQPAEIVRVAAMLGVTDLGENYLQEAQRKIEQLADLPIRWHFIGRIQANKTRAIAAYFDWVHSVDRLGLARRLAEQRPAHAPPLNLCIQVALAEEAGKGGLAPALLAATAARIAQLPRVRLRGLMCLAPAQADPSARRRVFARLRTLLQELNAGGLALDTLSMGMSADFEEAIAEGATHVRVGTSIFGERRQTP